MSPRSRRSSIAVLLAVSIVGGALAVGGAVGQTGTGPTPAGTGTPTETPTETPTATETEAVTAADEADEQTLAYLRVAHVSPDAPAVDVYVDGERALSDVEFGDVSGYQTLAMGDHTVRVTPAGDEETTVFEGDVTLEPRSASTLFAAGEVGENATEPFSPVLYGDDPIRPAEDEAAVSVSHMSPDAPAVDVTAEDGDVVLAENVSFGGASQYVTVPAGDYTVEIRPATANNDGDVVATANVSLEGGTASSAIALGYVNPDETTDGEALQVTLVEDASKTIHLPSVEGDDADDVDGGTPTEAVDETPTEADDETPTKTDEE